MFVCMFCFCLLFLVIYVVVMIFVFVGVVFVLFVVEVFVVSLVCSYDIVFGLFGCILLVFVSDNGVFLVFDLVFIEGCCSVVLCGCYVLVEVLYCLLLGSGLELQQCSDGSYILVLVVIDGVLEL